MIGFFPDPLPDELLYSACARYHARAGYRSRENTGFDLFGEPRAKVPMDLPCNLDTLLSNFPPGHCHTADRLIEAKLLTIDPSERAMAMADDQR